MFGYDLVPVHDTHFFRFYFTDDTRKDGKLVVHEVQMSGEAAHRMAKFIHEQFPLEREDS